MTPTNKERCPRLREAGIHPSQGGFSSGQGSSLDIDERNKIKDICTNCPEEKCVFDTNSEDPRIRIMKARYETIREMAKNGMGSTEIAARLGISRTTVQQGLRDWAEQEE